MTKPAVFPKVDLGETFPEVAADRVVTTKKPIILQQQRQDPEWLAQIKKQQQQGQSWQL